MNVFINVDGFFLFLKNACKNGNIFIILMKKYNMINEKLKKQIVLNRKNEKRVNNILIKLIMEKVTPLFWVSGYVSDGQNLKLCALNNLEKVYKVNNNFGFCGFTEQNAIITDVYIGLRFVCLNGLNTDDLLTILKKTDLFIKTLKKETEIASH